jgi:hypothetical protein
MEKKANNETKVKTKIRPIVTPNLKNNLGGYRAGNMPFLRDRIEGGPAKYFLTIASKNTQCRFFHASFPTGNKGCGN